MLAAGTATARADDDGADHTPLVLSIQADHDSADVVRKRGRPKQGTNIQPLTNKERQLRYRSNRVTVAFSNKELQELHEAANWFNIPRPSGQDRSALHTFRALVVKELVKKGLQTGRPITSEENRQEGVRADQLLQQLHTHHAVCKDALADMRTHITSLKGDALFGKPGAMPKLIKSLELLQGAVDLPVDIGVTKLQVERFNALASLQQKFDAAAEAVRFLLDSYTHLTLPQCLLQWPLLQKIHDAISTISVGHRDDKQRFHDDAFHCEITFRAQCSRRPPKPTRGQAKQGK
eukprot:jgi/Chlat1/1096/Chrsp110S01549